MDVRLSHPANHMVCGSSFSGKTTLIEQLIGKSQEIFTPAPKFIAYTYSEFQPAYERMKANSPIPITFYETFNEELYDKLPRDCLLVFDDNLSSIPIDFLNNVVVRGGHHRSITQLYVVHNIFQKSLRTVSLNTHYYWLTKNCRDVNQIKLLGTQLGVGSKFLLAVYKDAVQQPFSFLLVNLRPETPDSMRFMSNFLHPPITVYVPKDGQS
jgi:hypothetical protein